MGRLVHVRLACVALTLSAASISAAESPLVAAAKREGRVVVYSVLSAAAAQPLIADFEAAYPGIKVDYDGDKGSNDMDARFRRESAAGEPTADVVWSSAMDMQMQLVAQGYAETYRSPEARGLPRWANYRAKAYGTTLEPVVIVYNRNTLPASDVPRDHDALAKLLSTQTERFAGKVTGFDIVKSGVGYMFAAQDEAAYPRYPALLTAFGAAGIQPSGGTGEMLSAINSGKFLIGYNMMGAYAAGRSRKDLPNLAWVYPADYTLLLSRVAFVNKRAANPNAARLWLDYLLSARGQKVMGDRLELYPIRNGIEARFTATRLVADIGPSFRPIPLDMRLVKALSPAETNRILAKWRAAKALPN